MKIGSWISLKDTNIEDLVRAGCVISKSAMVHDSLKLCLPIHLSPRTQVKNDVKIDKFTFINWDSVLYPNVHVGAYCSIGRGVQIGLAKHPIDWLSTHTFQYNKNWFPNVEEYVNFKRDIEHNEHPLTTIGSDVWIGNNALINAGVSIGTGAIVGAGAVVVKDIPPYAIVGGVPAKIIRYRFSSVIIDKLLETKWWLKNIEDLNRLNFLHIEESISFFKK